VALAKNTNIWTFGAVLASLGAFAATAHAQIATDGSLGPASVLSGPNFAITADLGRRAGDNLFQSFERFGLATGEVATFSGPDAIRNVISRVTGGARSEIDGTLRSTIAGADFYLINPAGLMFGPNAALDIDGSFHGATADHIDFADGGRFSATTANGSTLSVAAPERFGFLSVNPASLTVSNSTLSTSRGNDLQLAGGNVAIDQAALTVSNGVLRIDAAGAGDDVLLSAVSPAALGGSLTVSGSNLNAAGTGGEGIRLSGGTIDIAGGTLGVFNNGFNPNSSPGLRVDGGSTVTIRDGAVLFTNSVFAGRVGAIDIRGERVDFDTAASVTAGASFAGLSDGVTITAAAAAVAGGSSLRSINRAAQQMAPIVLTIDGPLEFKTGGFIRASDVSTGSGSDVMVTANTISLTGGSTILTDGFFSGTAGALSVTANESLNILAGTDAPFTVGIFSRANATGDSASVKLKAPVITLQGATIASVANGGGSAGTLNLDADRIVMTESAIFNRVSTIGGPRQTGTITLNATESLIARSDGIRNSITTGSASNAGKTGAVDIRAPIVDMENFLIRTDTFDDDAGSLTVSGDTIRLGGFFQVFTTGANQRKSGAITMTATNSLEIRGSTVGLQSQISNDPVGESSIGGDMTFEAPDVAFGQVFVRAGGDLGSTAGKLTIRGDRVTLLPGTTITTTANTVFSGGAAGDILIVATEKFHMQGNRQDQDPVNFQFTEVSAGAGGGAASAPIVIEAPEILLEGGLISNASGGILAITFGEDGVPIIDPDEKNSITLRGQRIIIDSASISGDTLRETDGGELRLVASERIDILNKAQVTSRAVPFLDQRQVERQGRGGEVIMIAPDIVISDSVVSADSFGPSNAGEIGIAADRLTVTDGATMTSAATADGNSGDVTLTVRDTLTLANGGTIGARSAAEDTFEISVFQPEPIIAGDAGRVTANARNVVMDGGILSVTSVDGDGGELSVKSTTLAMTNNAEIRSSSAGDGVAGNIVVEASVRAVMQNSAILAEAQQGDGGNITLIVGELIRLDGSRIETSVASGVGNGGNIDIDPEFVVLFDSEIEANAFGGNGGNITIVADTILADGDSVIRASSALGIEGTVAIDAAEADVTGALTLLNSEFLNAAALLAQQCAARGGQSTATLSAAGRGALPDGPNNVQTGHYFAGAPVDPEKFTAMAMSAHGVIRQPVILALKCSA